MARLCEPINLEKLAQEGVEFQIDSNFIKEDDSCSEEDPAEILERKLGNRNLECTGVFDEDVYEEGEPFEIIANKMVNLVPDGRIKKRILREGDGAKPFEFALVKVHYNAYVEYEDEPFDSTYIRNKPYKFTLNDGRVIPGLDFGVQSMRLNEKAQFLIHPDYAFSKNCLIGRVPDNATVLFEVELLEIINSGATVTYDRLSEDQQKLFSEVYKYCTALCEKAKRSFLNHDFKKAIKDYNTAAARLTSSVLVSKDETEKHRELSLKVHTNLLICYTRIEEPRKGCTNAKRIYDLTENGELFKISAKVYFNHAKCLRILGEYDEAKTILDKAYRLEPRNPEIANEMLNLENDKLEHRNKREVFAKALVGEARGQTSSN